MRLLVMQVPTLPAPLLLAPVLLMLFAACGDVGEAPEAQIGEAVSVANARGEAFVIDTTRSHVKWKAAKVTRAHDGGFHVFDGTVSVRDGEVTGISVNIDTRSIWSDTDRLTNHLKSSDFFDVKVFPSATFESAEIAPTDSVDATHLVTGNLTMHGQTNGVTFPAAILVEDGTAYATADFIIDRTDWGINYTGQADDLIRNDVRLLFDIVAVSDEPVRQVQSE